MSFLVFIPVVINKDPELAIAIFDCECSFIAKKAHNISEKRKREKRRSVCMRPYLTRRASKGHYNNQS